MATETPRERGPLIGLGRTAEIYAWGDDQALKLYHTGWPRISAEHEAQISRVVAAAGVLVPAIAGMLELDGRYGIVFERLVGPSLLHLVAARPWMIGNAVRTFTDLHLAMHAHVVTASDLPSLRERLARQIAGTSAMSDRIRTAALGRLEQLPEGDALCHGDYHPDNVLVTRRGPIIIDWGSACRGHPLADVAQTELLLLIGEPPPLRSRLQRELLASARAYVRRTYLRRYLRPWRRLACGEELTAWHLPIAVARLAEGVAGEQSTLLHLIARLATS